MAFQWSSSITCALSVFLLTHGKYLSQCSSWAISSWSHYSNFFQGLEVEKSSKLHHESQPWSEIIPTRELVYQSCFDGFNCTRLDLPMDWNATSKSAPRIQLAIAKLPARVPVIDPRYGGLLWLQSGGPGESGIEFVLKYGKSIQMIVDSGLHVSEDHHKSTPQKYFDIIGIDSRGLNNSTPCFSCFPTLQSREIWTLQSSAEGLLGTSNTSFSSLWARSRALGKGCSGRASERKTNGDKLASHVNTTPQIADMTAILELHGKWREEEARQLIDKGADVISEKESLQIIERTGWEKDKEKLQFWGFSYGTVIGTTFATMQPHRVERVVLDGVVDTSDYFLGERKSNLQDTDKLLEKLFEHCSLAGPERCALYEKGGNQTIMHKFGRILETLKQNPVGVAATRNSAPRLITYSDVLRAVFTSMYAPIQDFPTLSRVLADLSEGNGTSFDVTKHLHRTPQAVSSKCLSSSNLVPCTSEDCTIQHGSPGDTRMAILCSDSNSTNGMTREDFLDFVEVLRIQSKWFGPLYAQFRMMCVAWNLKAKWRVPGPFAGKTAYPMLVVGNKLDPVTPIRNAYTLAERFHGSVVLANDGEGHSSLSAPSLCMAHHLRQYFQAGLLPVTGTVCDSDEKPFLGLSRPGDGENMKLLDELMWVARHWN